MKKKLNLLCVLVFCVLALTLAESFYGAFWGFKEGIKVGMETPEEVGKEFTNNLSSLHMFPKGLIEMNDSVYNQKTEKFVPVWHVDSLVSIPTETPLWLKIIGAIISFLMLFYGIKSMIWFIRLIKAINRSEIFCWRNVKLLRKLGMALLIVFGCKLIRTYMDTLALQKVLQISGYAYNYLYGFSDASLLLSVISLIVAEIFAIGLKMKEEQDLTI